MITGSTGSFVLKKTSISVTNCPGLSDTLKDCARGSLPLRLGGRLGGGLRGRGGGLLGGLLGGRLGGGDGRLGLRGGGDGLLGVGGFGLLGGG